MPERVLVSPNTYSRTPYGIVCAMLDYNFGHDAEVVSDAIEILESEGLVFIASDKSSMELKVVAVSDREVTVWKIWRA